MEVQCLVSELLYSNMYAIKENGHTLLIDPNEAEVYLGQVDMILLTHEHYDHISGVNFWKRRTGAPVLCSEACAENISDSRKNLSRYFNVFCELQTWVEVPPVLKSVNYTCTSERTFRESEIFFWQGHELYLFSCPGHSHGSTGILLDGAYLFAGDSLMRDYPVETHLPGGKQREWEEYSLPRLRNLPGNITVYPGHFKDFLLSEYKYW